MVLVLVDGPLFTQGKDRGGLGVFFLEEGQDFLAVRPTGQGLALDFVDEEAVDLIQGGGQDVFVDGGGVEVDVELAFGGLFHHLMEAGDFILEEDEVPFFKMGEDGIHIGRIDGPVGPAGNDDGVVPLAVDLDNRVARGEGGPAHKVGMDVGGLEGMDQAVSVLFPNQARMPNLPAGPGDGDGLVEALAPDKLLVGEGGEGLALPDHMGDPVGLINIQ